MQTARFFSPTSAVMQNRVKEEYRPISFIFLGERKKRMGKVCLFSRPAKDPKGIQMASRFSARVLSSMFSPISNVIDPFAAAAAAVALRDQSLLLRERSARPIMHPAGGFSRLWLANPRRQL